MLFLFRLFWIVILIFVIRYLLVTIVAPLFQPRRQPPTPELRGTAHKDPQCGIYVGEDVAVIEQAGSQTFYFCSRECRDRYLKRNPR